MEYAIIGLLILVSILLIYIIIRLKNVDKNNDMSEKVITSNYETTEKISGNFNQLNDRIDLKIQNLMDKNIDFERTTTENLRTYNETLRNTMDKQFTGLQESMEARLTKMDKKVNESLEEGFKKSKETFTNIVERLSRIDEAQKKIDGLTTEIVSLQDVLTDKRARGAFGEVQLHQILSAIFGEKNDPIYQLQYTFENGTRSDAVLFAPEPLGTIAIDSKFPLENYRKTIDTNLDDTSRAQAEKDFVADCKKHIDAISSKYIIDGVTSNQALMFVPAEAVFAYINAYMPQIIDYANKKRVWIVSPTTLMSTLTVIQTILTNIEREKYASVIHDNLKILGTEFERYRERWDKLNRSLDSITKEAKNISITTDKITKRFDSISNVEEKQIDTLD